MAFISEKFQDVNCNAEKLIAQHFYQTRPQWWKRKISSHAYFLCGCSQAIMILKITKRRMEQAEKEKENLCC